MKKSISITLAAMALVAGCSSSTGELEEGRWTGQMMRPAGGYLDLYFLVENADDSLKIELEVPDFHTFPLNDVRIEGDSLLFWWYTSVRLDCILERQEDRSFQGGCFDELGSRGPLVMIPPDVDPGSIKLDKEAFFANWEPPKPPKSRAELMKEEEIAPGTSVDVGGRNINMLIKGEGDVTVVFESGHGDDLGVWTKVMSALEGGMRVVGYDRAGLGYSDPGPQPFDITQAATDLHTALKGAGVAPPFVLVGHAEGGFILRRFASLFTDEIAGIVLVDPAHELLGVRLKELDSASWEKFESQKRTFLASLPEPLLAEFEAFSNVLETQSLPGGGEFPDVPLVVITSDRKVETPGWVGETEQGHEIKKALHAVWAGQVTRGKHVVVENSGPYVHREKPEIVTEAIQWVVDSINK